MSAEHPKKGGQSTAEKYAVLLPCEPDEFSHFVSGLLGKPQTIEKYFHGAFELSREQVSNTFHLVNQRINQQNVASLIQFTVKIIYDDNSSVLLNSLDDFEHYNEVRPLKSVGVTLSWTYLIRFQQKNAPERQQIDLTFRAGSSGAGDLIVEDGVLISRRRSYLGPSGISLRINHTDRTWGVDIESLLTGHVKTLFVAQNKTASFLSKNSEKIGLFVGIVFFLGSIVGAYFSTRKFIDSYLRAVSSLSKGVKNHSDLLFSKIDFLMDIITKGVWPRYILSIIIFILICIIISIVLGIWVAAKADNSPRSFVLLSKSAEEEWKHILNKTKRDWLVFCVSIVASIITGILANIIFSTYFAKI